jgi:iron complex outermembrane recepter protein
MSIRLVKNFTAILVGSIMLFGGNAAGAQDRARDDDSGLQEVVVTAQRRTQSLNEIPYNLQVVNSDALERAGLDSASDIGRMIPGLAVTGTGGRSGLRLTLRGLRTGEDQNTDPTTSSYIDEVPIDIPGLRTLDPQLLDLERVEVLRGPQGTLYGAGAIGGTIRYISRKPSLTKFEGRVGGGLSATQDGSLNHELNGMVNLPLAEDRAALRLNVGYADLDGYIDDVGLSRKNINGERTLDTRLALYAKLSDRFSLEATYYFNGGDFGSNSSFDTRFPTRTTRNDAVDAEDSRIHLFNVTPSWTFGPGTLTSSTSYARGEIDTSTDETIEIRDVIYASFIAPEDLPEIDTLSARVFEAKTFTQELRFVSTGDGPFNYVVGAYYSRNEATQDYQDLVANFPFPGRAAFETFTGYSITDNVQYIFATDNERTQLAGFFEANYRWTPALQTTLGARFFRYETEGQFYSIDNYFGTDARDAAGRARSEPIFPNEFTFGEAKDDGSVFKFNAAYQFGNKHQVYATVASGYRPGGFNLVSPATGVSPDQFQYFPDEILNYEIGSRWNLFDGRGFVSGAIYQIDWTDLQTQEQTALGFVLLGNAGEARVRGLEVEFNSEDLLAPGWALAATYGYTDGRLTETIPLLGFDGDRMPFTSRYSGSLQLDYERATTGGLQFGVNLMATYRSESFSRFGRDRPVFDPDGAVVAADNPAYVRVAPSTVVDLSARLNGERWFARLFADNLFDETQENTTEVLLASGPYNDGTIVNRFIGRPRTIGVDVTYKF